jgi:succinate dehydrogenase / fumarate reductase, cytochrome b subunit
MSSLKATATGYTRYRGREGQISFMLHRLTGLGTLLFLTIHILDTATAYFIPSMYAHAIALYRNPLFMLGEIALVFAVTYHGVNGIRIALSDWFPGWWTINRERAWSKWGWLVAILLWLPAALWMGRSLIINTPFIANIFGIGG